MAGKPAIAKEDERDQSNRQNKREIIFIYVYEKERYIRLSTCQTRYRSHAAYGSDEVEFFVAFFLIEHTF